MQIGLLILDIAMYDLIQNENKNRNLLFLKLFWQMDR